MILKLLHNILNNIIKIFKLQTSKSKVVKKNMILNSYNIPN